MKKHVTISLAVALASGLLFTPPVSAKAPASRLASAAAAQQQSGVPFTEAAVRRTSDGNVMIGWSGAEAGQVQVYALDSALDDRGRLVGSGGAAGHVSLAAATVGNSRFFRLVPSHGSAITLSDRLAHIEGAPNLRDIGGYRTMDGRWVRMGRIYRSDKLSRLTPEAVAQFAALDIGTVGDLRSASEREKEPDRLPQGVQYRIFDIMGAQAAPGNFMKALMDGQGATMMQGINRELVGSATAQKEFAGLLGAMAASGRPFLYHCTAGKDRTGWASAVLLSILGVPRETVIYDYMISRERLKSLPAAAIVGEADNPFSALPKELTDPLMTVE
ncbi:MAG: tyrosine-protein phosphatase, partial [Sphingobium sp.]